MNRRDLLQAGVASAACTILPTAGAAGGWPSDIQSDLVRLSPLRSGAFDGRCQAEVWYVLLGTDVYACMGTGSWHALAARQGLAETELTILGPGGASLEGSRHLAPVAVIASVETRARTIESVLRRFETKYGEAWDRWGGRYRREITEGTRTMLRYPLQRGERVLAQAVGPDRSCSMTKEAT